MRCSDSGLGRTTRPAQGRTRSLSASGLQTGELLGRFGVTSDSQRTVPMLAAIGVDPHRPGELELEPEPESPVYLTAARRRQLIADRDRLADSDR